MIEDPLQSSLMPRKKTTAMEETEDIRKTVDFVSQDISAIKTKQDKIVKVVEEVTELHVGMEEKDKKIAAVERTVEDVEEYSRLNDCERIKDQTWLIWTCPLAAGTQ